MNIIDLPTIVATDFKYMDFLQTSKQKKTKKKTNTQKTKTKQNKIAYNFNGILL